ncbi:MAG: valine--tRNA ligase [Gemmatimonadetes bacterium]|nr:valine--tRNA ligase [Gemmatimonadota bacterium]
MAEPLSPQYDPHAVEAPLYRAWEEAGYFRADAERVLSGEREPYTIVIPPPNVTSMLHIGHGLNNTLQDVLIRFRRMQGREALWVPGTDHAGIATQNVVERILAKDGKTRYDLGREAFVERTWEHVRATEATILGQLRAIGSSCDWSRTRFTLDPGLSRAVREVFVRLYEKGLVYRGNYIINWCPRCLTALSEEEAEPEESQGALYHLRYPVVADGDLPAGAEGLPRLPDGRRYIVVATTRPETMLGDTAVAVHPGDERYRALVGAMVDLPLTGRRIPIVADEYVDPEFGSGAVKITPAHDPNDFELARRQGLPALDIMTPEATIGTNAPEAFQGLDRFEARRAVVDAFREAGLLERVEAHTHAVPHCYRCHTVVEPRLSDQWFVRMKPLAEPALAAYREGRVRFTPETWGKVYENWLEGIRDWCISRQLWWGHRIPVWYCRAPGCEDVEIVGREDPTTCPRCGGSALEQDPDVLDTWFSSWLWPFSTLGWPDETRDLRAFYPTSTLVSAYDILFFWVSRMIMAGLEFMGEVPFREVYITRLVRDHLGRKMSKSLGNGIDPLQVVELFGADALRFTLVEGTSWTADQLLNYQDLEQAFAPGRNFANKLWNAGRFALMNLEGDEVPRVEDVRAELEVADRWILSRLNRAIAATTAALETFRFHEVAGTVYHFFWDEVADWYIELAKSRLRGEAGEASRAAAQATLVEVLDGVLRLLHPVMPFISEALWQRLPSRPGVAREPSLVIARWPEPSPEREDPEAEAQLEALMELIGTVRGLRSEYNVPPSAKIEVRVGHASDALRRALAAETRAVQRLAGVREVYAEAADGAPAADGWAGAGAHAVLRSGADVFIPLAQVIDLGRERARLEAELERVLGQLRSTESKLANEQFRAKAPADVVAKEVEKAANLREQQQRLARKIEELS